MKWIVFVKFLFNILYSFHIGLASFLYYLLKSFKVFYNKIINDLVIVTKNWNTNTNKLSNIFYNFIKCNRTNSKSSKEKNT